ncbi:MAG: methyl-accepting chemotaxis protein [Deltaproteobacteria bacterium]|nr:methyl-accepting chemotaxis protein [Deltaproteobacteria bacterium]
MHFTLKTKILFLVGVITLASLLGSILLINNHRVIGESLRVETERHIKALIGRNAERIETTMLVMEKNADDLATAGEAFFSIYRTTGQDITGQIEEYLVNNFRKLPTAIGGGLWYEPYVLFEEKKNFGPYAYRENDRVLFTWDLNTPEYDYHNQAWYRLAIPKGWDRSRKRLSRIYWTDPYFDEAATRALMITVDALMYDRQGMVIGLATVDFSLGYLGKMVAGMTVTPGSLPFAVDLSSGLLIGFPADTSRVMEKIQDLAWGKELGPAQGMVPGEVQAKHVSLGGNDFLLFYTATSTGTGLGILVPCRELYEHIDRLNRSGMYTFLMVILVQIVLYLLIIFFMLRRICNPISRLTDVAQGIAEGDLSAASKALKGMGPSSPSSRDETERLMAVFQGMTENLKGLLARVQGSGTQVASSSTQIASSSRQIESTVKEQAVSINRASVSSKEISDTANALAVTMNELVSAASETAVLAGSGQAGLEEMEDSMQGVLKGTESVSSRLEEIKQNAMSIDSIVSTITRVADQTNLLSLNAAIEAEKAGEYGLGFSVVAEEIRRLADQTSVAVIDIEDMVDRMEKSISAGAAEMDSFSLKVGSAVDQITRTGKQLEAIVERVLTLTPRFEKVNEAMEAQSGRAGEISETMSHLNHVIGSTVETLREFNVAAEYLRQAAQGLQDEVSRFRVS